MSPGWDGYVDPFFGRPTPVHEYHHLLEHLPSAPFTLYHSYLKPTVKPICPVPLTLPKQQRKILGQFLMEPSRSILLRASEIASVQQWG